ncbi:MAG: hypothetical protein Q4B50_05145 [Bacillota bacterium]|nr:hypothetical protein [Bacillota bacterium]
MELNVYIQLWLEQLLELEEEERKKKAEERILEMKMAYYAYQEKMLLEEMESEEMPDIDPKEVDDEAHRMAEEEARQMREADRTIDLLGFDDSEHSEEETNELIDALIGRRNAFGKAALDQNAPPPAAMQNLPQAAPQKAAQAPEIVVPQPEEPEALQAPYAQPVETAPVPIVESSPLSTAQTKTDPQPAKQDKALRGKQVVNALRHLKNYSEKTDIVSGKQAEVGRICKNIIKRAMQQGISLEEMGMGTEDIMAVKGGIELGEIVRNGKIAQDILLHGRGLPPQLRERYMQDFLTMKAMEQTKSPLAGNGKEQNLGSSIHRLLGSPGFSAKDLCRLVGQSEAMRKFRNTPPKKLKAMITESSLELDNLGRLAMTACIRESIRKIKSQNPELQQSAPLRVLQRTEGQ